MIGWLDVDARTPSTLDRLLCERSGAKYLKYTSVCVIQYNRRGKAKTQISDQ